jgi:alpha-L-fucosidase
MEKTTSDVRQAAKLRFYEAKYGLFLHYGLYSLLARHEWVQFKERIPVADYAKLADTFTAAKFDARAIARLAVSAGMRYVNLTTRHHESFCLWNTGTTDFNSAKAPHCGRDLVAELAEACAAEGLGLCLYLSHGRDWRHPHAPGNDRFGGSARPVYAPPEPAYATGTEHHLQQYLDYLSEQVRELLTGYGPIMALWLDGIGVPLNPLDDAGKPVKDYDPRHHGDPFRCQDLYDLSHRLQPECLVSYKQGYLGTEDFFAPEHHAYNRFGEAFGPERPGEVCTTMIKEPSSWGYFGGPNVVHRNEAEVWEAIERTAKDNCNLLLNCGPDPEGAIEECDASTLRAVGKRLQRER